MSNDRSSDADVRQLAHALRASIGLLRRRLQQSPVRSGLTLPQVAALARLDRGGPATAGELARQEQISPQSMGVTLGELENRALIDWAQDPSDGRRKIISITPDGLDALRDRRDARVAQMAEALAAEFTAEELQVLIAAAPLIERLARRL